ncbi:efflux RND transporter periplasmic adaptor subunit [Parabacteroides sp. PF5-9]|uniref:efflux RND transporter periplasmic adaptor subunit n=1 Tax=Parabacteroides sp. PF5-9 TaxID=1742404 RepID=UPI002476DC8E|nr:efflux RND transporter periplasmic adaptor subunit [Parabacteroides sp. PF5-9]MDH6359080.1 cobalt-zinc-cadmium efflux system membrane fusion protein [Parabacteroides sp. PF5-9]
MKKIVISTVVLLLFACNGKKESLSDEVSDTMAIENEMTEELFAGQSEADTEPMAMVNHSSFNGVLMTPPQRYATVTPTMGGTVHSTNLLNGIYIKKGTVIATLENPEFITLQQEYLDAYAQTTYLKSEFERQERLSVQEAASQKRFEQSKAEYLSMKSRLEGASAQLTILGVSPKDVLSEGIQPYLEIKSPLSGYVSGMNINLGKYINGGDPICEVIDKGETLLQLTVYEKDLMRLQSGSPVLFRVNSLGDQEFNAEVISVGQAVDPVNRSLEVYARVKESNVHFRPGMYVSARIEKKSE